MALNPAGIVTPEAVVLDFELAGMASRGVAKLIDVLIQGAILLALGVIIGTASSGAAGVIVLVIGIALVVLGYPILCEVAMRGRSPGKAAFGLRVVTTEGAPAAPRHAFIRSIVGLVDFLIPIPGGLTAITCSLLSPRSQRLGDLAAGTMVLRERSATSAPMAVWFNPPPGLEAYSSNLDVATVTDTQFGVIRSFLLRVHELSHEARVAMAHRIATPVASAMHHRPPPGVYAEQFLVAVAAAYQRRHSPVPAGSSATPAAAAAYPPPPVGAYGAPPPPPVGAYGAPPPPPPPSASYPPPPPPPPAPPPPPPPATRDRPVRTRPLAAPPVDGEEPG